MKLLIILFAGFILNSACHFSSNELRSTHRRDLYGEFYKIWDARIGSNWVLFSDSSLLEFNYDSGKRYISDYGDFHADTLRYTLNKDTFTTSLGQKCVILKVSEDSLVLKDFTKIWGADTLYFLRAPNQNGLPQFR